jgi:hypothetical protein
MMCDRLETKNYWNGPGQLTYQTFLVLLDVMLVSEQEYFQSSLIVNMTRIWKNYQIFNERLPFQIETRLSVDILHIDIVCQKV